MSDNNNDAVQHGIDDNPNDDAKKGLELGALGGGTVGAIAGAALGPLGMIVGALIGGSVGSVASGAAVQAVDTVDNDDTVSGLGEGVTTKDDLAGPGSNYGTTGQVDSTDVRATPINTSAPSVYAGTTNTSLATPDVNLAAIASGDYESGSYAGGTDVSDSTTDGADVRGHNAVTGNEAHSGAGKAGLGAGAVAGGLLGAAAGGPVGAIVGGTIGSLAGGVAGDATETVAETTETSSASAGTTTPYVHARDTNTR